MGWVSASDGGRGQTGDGAETGDPQPARLPPRPRHHRLQRHPADPHQPRPVPADQPQQGVGVGHEPDLDAGEQIDDQPADGRRAGRLRLGAEWMGTRLGGQSGQPVAVPPGRDQGAPPVGRLPFRPAVVVDGRQQPIPVTGGDQTGAGGGLQHEARVSRVGAERPAEGGDVAQGDATVTEQPVRDGLEGVCSQLDVVHEPVRGPDRRPVDDRGCTRRAGERRRRAGYRLRR